MQNLARATMLLAASFAAVAQTSRAPEHKRTLLSGNVFDSCGTPITTGKLTLRIKGNSAALAATRLEGDGTFEFPLVSPGVYELRLEVAGEQPLVKTVDISDGCDLNLRVQSHFPNLPLCHDGVPVHYEQSPVPGELHAVTATVCDIVRDPTRFNGKVVSLRDRIHFGLEEFELNASNCANRKLDAIWLEYGKGSAHQNDEFYRLDHFLKSGVKDDLHGKCSPYDVTATLTGRFDAVPTVPCASCARFVIQSVAEVTAH